MRTPVLPEVDRRLRRLELRFGPLGFDPFGVSRDQLGWSFSLLWPFYRWYFRTRVHGQENIPTRGRAMLVGNHSGGIPIDALLVIAAAFFDLEPPRLAHGMVDKFVAAIPFVGDLARGFGQLTGLPEHAVRLLEDEQLLLVFPEGARGTAKLYPDRLGLVDFGTGFVRLALQTKSPIVPFACAGTGDAVPSVLNAERLGRLLGAPYIPITPWGLPLPRPARVDIVFGEAMTLSGTGAEEDEVIEREVASVRARIEALLEEAERRRRER